MHKTSLPALTLAAAAVLGAPLLEVDGAQAALASGGAAQLDTALSATGQAATSTVARRTLRCHGFRATIVGTAGDDVLRGTPRRDVIVALGGADRIDGRRGKDVVCGGRGADFILGGRGADRLYGGYGADTLQASTPDRAFGGPGGDTLYAYAGSHLSGNSGRDEVTADPAAHVHTGPGDDVLDIQRMGRAGGRPTQVLVGGSGHDTVRVMGDDEGDPVVIDLRAGTARSGATSGRFTGFENAVGDLGNDVLLGAGGANTLLGDWGEDRIDGRAGDDILDGQEDDDILDGGTGNDRCSAEVTPPSSCESVLEPAARR